jgi:8-oxo-dGTP diphosphatase
VRCAETVQPLSESIGVPVREEPLLGERGFPGHEEEALELLRNLGRPGGAAVACSQRGVIDELVARLAEQDEVELGDEELGLKKGGVWALSFYDHKLLEAERFPPPKASAETE